MPPVWPSCTLDAGAGMAARNGLEWRATFLTAAPAAMLTSAEMRDRLPGEPRPLRQKNGGLAMLERLDKRPNDLSAFWMPFTANRQFKQAPRMLVAAQDMHYTTDDGRKVLDGTSGLWCVNAGHCRPKITEAIREQAGKLDYAPAFQMGHPIAFEFANRLVDVAPEGLDHVFFTNSGSESVETALKIALAYHRVKGEGSRTR